MAKPSKHGPGYPGVPVTPLSPINLTAQSLMPKAGPNKPAARTLRMATPLPVGKSAGTSSGKGKVKQTSSAAGKKGTFGARLGF